MTNETSVSCIPEQALSFVVAPVWTSTESVVEQHPDEKYVDQCYENLRLAIGKAFKPYLDKGSVFFLQRTTVPKGDGMVNKDTLSHSVWLAAITDPTIRRHYNCNMCRSNWSFLFNLAVLEDDFTLTYPAITALLANRDDPMVNSLFSNAPDDFLAYLLSIPGDTTREYYPVTNISTSLKAETDSAGWNHFYLASKQDIETYNSRYEPFNDFKYIDSLATMMLHPELDLHALKILFDKVKAKLGTSNDPIVNYALGNTNSFLTVTDKARAINALHRGLGVPYIWAQICDTSKAFLQHVQGSVLGIVLEAYLKLESSERTSERLQAIVEHTVTAIQQNAADENYKLKSASAKADAVKEACQLLKEKGWEHVLERCLLPVTEVTSFIWKPTAEAPAYLSPDTYDENAQCMANVLPSSTIPLKVLLASLDNVARINLTNTDRKQNVSFKTTSSVKGDYTGLINFHGNIGTDVLGLSYAKGINFREVMDLAGVPTTGVLEVKGIYSHDIPGNTQKEYILQLDGVAENVAKDSAGSGSCVFRSMVKNQYLSLASVLNTMSREHVLDFTAGVPYAGGVVIAENTCLSILYKDGSHCVVTINSLK